MIDFGSKYTIGIYTGLGFYSSWSFAPAATVVGTVSSYRTLTGMGI